jgi:DNA-binding Lrp family transcriptional regulator
LLLFNGNPWYVLLIKHNLVNKYDKVQVSKLFNLYFFELEGVPSVLFGKFFPRHFWGIGDYDRKAERYKTYCKEKEKMTSAFLFINAELLFVEDVINKLKEIPEIVDVYKVQGIYDIIARVNSDTEEKLKELVSEHIRRIDRITGTVTVIIAKEIESSSRE